MDERKKRVERYNERKRESRKKNGDKGEDREMNGWSEVDERLREHCLITSASAAVSRHTTHTCLND